ncbi:MAG: magnesium transporter CorA family protein [Paracoccaceae bacterium]|nr:magnesium transporter CorA family protein [Paracoccaceae bacterium]
MLRAFRTEAGRLMQIAPDDDLATAIWIDLFRPTEAEVAAMLPFGIAVPSLTEMEEIEISNRLYREDGADYLTVVLPGQSDTATPIAGPVTFILRPGLLVTVRHHSPRPFETFPPRADKGTPGCASADHLFLGLLEEIVGRLADILEGVGRGLDAVTRDVFSEASQQDNAILQRALVQTGLQGETMSRVRLGLLSLERAIGYFSQSLAARHEGDGLRSIVTALNRDITALEVHVDFLSGRLSLAVDATLGMINLAQNVTVRIVSVVAVLFLPPTLIASLYGMNFKDMPELSWAYGYPYALTAMVVSAIGTYLIFKWRKWL